MGRRFPGIVVALAVLLVAVSAGAAPRVERRGFTDVDPIADTLAGEVAVDLTDDLPEPERKSLLARIKAVFTATSPLSAHDGLGRLRVPAGTVAAALSALKGDPRVERAEPMTVLRASFVPNDPLYAPLQWHLRKVGAESAWAHGCGRGVTVAVIDTGIACVDKGPFAKGSDLAGTRCVAGKDFVRWGGKAADDHGHGTHVAGTIAQTTHNTRGVAGVAYCATLMPIKVLSRGGWGRVTAVAQGIRWAADHGAQVINLSLGGPLPSLILADAVKYAQSRGALVVAAAGNSGRWVEYPARLPGVLAVAATNQNDGMAAFSSRGRQLFLGAPGVDVTQQTVCDGGMNKCELFATYRGTSMASPHVAGAAALLMGMGLTDPAHVRGVLARTAAPTPTKMGAGRLDVGAAARRTHLGFVLFRLTALGAIVGWLVVAARRQRATFRLGAGHLFLTLALAVGAAPFLPWLDGASWVPGQRWLVELAATPVLGWDGAFLGASAHAFLLPATAAIPVGLVAVAFGRMSARPLIGAVAVGTAAYAIAHAVGGGVAIPYLGVWGTSAWLALNAAACLWVARIASVE